ncbi:hypothetical protein E2C01_078632 [Portunus trituberculatus]|uniref:Uncharacterized protein n=1 Tax=Portunus trituberculatus TaxID=210409 RepID=A0A5B7IEU2_PORTR|nr:hypothetical protein [Portunus trituberculatus]
MTHKSRWVNSRPLLARKNASEVRRQAPGAEGVREAGRQGDGEASEGDRQRSCGVRKRDMQAEVPTLTLINPSM